MPEEYYSNLRPELRTFLPGALQGKRILEIGCGSGSFRTHFPADCEYWGIEPVAEAANRARAAMHQVLVGTYEDVEQQLPDDYFDCVICNDVIEHMPSETAFLNRIRHKLSPTGRLVGSVPNVRYILVLTALLLRRDWRYTDSGVMDRTHLRFFTLKSLHRTFQETGWEVQALSGINRITPTWSSGMDIAKSLAMILLMGVLGRDTKFLQFGFCATPQTGAAAPQG